MESVPASGWWWILASVLLIVELTLGTVQLLILAVAAATAALTAHAGLGDTGQIWVAAAVALVGTLSWRALRLRRTRWRAGASEQTVRSLDEGQTVYVDQWLLGDQTRVNYRGSTWNARCQGESARAGMHVIVGTDGNCLLLAPQTACAESPRRT